MRRLCGYRKTNNKKTKSKSHTIIMLAKKKGGTKSDDVRRKSYIVAWGENKIEISHSPKGRVIVYDASVDLPSHHVGKRMRRIAEILKQSHSANLRRLGFDLLEEQYEDASEIK